MIKKFGQYLPAALLAVAAAVLLFSTAADSRPPAETVPTVPETVAQTTAPASDRTTPDTVEAAPRPDTADALPRVAELLSGHRLDETATALCVYDEKLYADDTPAGTGKAAVAHALARLCGERRMNPISAFWALEAEGVYTYEQDTGGILNVGAFEVPDRKRKDYPCTAKGTRQLLTDILDLARDMDDGMELEKALLGWNGKVEADRIFHAEGDCYYSYFVYYGESAAHFLCFYVRGGEKIDHVEFQMLNLCYKDGPLGPNDRKGETQAALLMAASELLLTGSCRVSEGSAPLGYTLEGGKVTIDRYEITGPGEIGTLINYGIKTTE